MVALPTLGHISLTYDGPGNGIINADGDIWKVQRKAGLQFLNNSNMRVLTEVALPTYIENSLTQLSRVGIDEEVDLDAIFHELTTQIMGRMAYDVSGSAKF